MGREAARYKFEGNVRSIAYPRDDVDFFVVGGYVRPDFVTFEN